MNKHCGLPVIYLENSVCQFVQEVKYLVNFTYKLIYCYEILDIALMM